jgi:hypothetical protein
LAITFGAPAGAVGAQTTKPVKPVMAGLVDRNAMPPAAYQRVLSGFVVNVTWAELQPTAGGPITTGNVIDEAIAALRSLPKGVNLRLILRVTAGTDAPDWAKRLGGDPIAISHKCKRNTCQTETIGRFWTDAFGQAYQGFQKKLAARYDGVPKVAQVEIDRCTTFYAEPFLRDPDVATNVQSLLAAGYTAAADDCCQRQEIDAHQVWATTRSGLALNPYDRIDADGTYTTDEAYTEQVMAYCRSTLGSRCVLENHSLRSPLQDGPYTSLFSAMLAAGPPLGFQTASPERIGDWQAALQWAVDAGANYVELNKEYPTYDLSALQTLATGLQAN